MNTSNGTDFANSHTYTPYADAIRIGNNCNAPSSIPSYCTAPYPGTLNDIRVDHVQVYNARMTGIAVNYADRVILTNNTVMHVGQGITSANSVGSNVISGNIVRDSSDDLIGVYNNEYLINPNAQTGKAVISNNVLGQGYAKAIGVGGIGHVVISNNTTEQTWAAGILVEDQAVFNETASTDVLITGNVINSAGTYYGANQFHTAPSPDGASGMFFYGTPSTLNDLKIENNIITGYYFHGIEFTTASGMGVTQATIANNYINGSPTCPVCVSSGIQSTGDGIVVGVPGDTTSTSVAGLRIHDNTILNSAQSGIQLGGSNKVSIKNNWIEGFNANPGGQQTEGIGINYANSLIMDNNIVINSNGGTYPYHFFYTNTAVSQSRNLYSSGVGQPWTDYSASAAPLQATYQQMDAQPATGGMLGFLLDRADAPGAGLSIYAPSNNHMDIMTGPGTGTYLVVTSGWTASGGTVTFTETSGPTLAAGTLIAPNGLAGCSTASGVSPLNNGYYSVLSGATSTSFQISTTLITGGGSGTCNFTPLAPAMRFDTGYGGGINPGYMRLAPLSTDFTGATHPIEFGASSYYGDQAGNFYLNSLHIAGCTGYLYSNGTCSIPATGLADPGSNGIVKRTALNTTAPATAADVTTLFASGSCVGYMKGDGTCANVSPGGYVQLGHTVVSGTTTTSVVFSAINQGYTNLILVMYGATSDSGPNARIDCEYNSDTTAADYVGQYVQGVGTVTTSGALTGAATGIECGVLAAATANSSYNATTSTVSIPSYASSAFTTKAATLTTSYPASTGLISQTTVTSWKQANGTAITSITVTDGIGGHFMPGTTFTLYGEP
jgi:parallel beta-helix repeat protein